MKPDKLPTWKLMRECMKGDPMTFFRIVFERIEQIGTYRVATFSFFVSAGCLFLGLATRFVLLGYFFSAVYLLIAIVLFIYGWQSKGKEKPLDVQPYKMNRGRGMPQNPRDIYWLALQRFWGLLEHGKGHGVWETAVPPIGNKLRMQVSIPGGGNGAIYWQDVRSDNRVTTGLGQFSGKCIQGLAAVYGTDSFGMSKASKIRLMETDLFEGEIDADLYGSKFIRGVEEYVVFVQPSVIDALMEIDNTQRSGGKFVILKDAEEQ